jgi:molybdenum cofactor guanylyltransferase
MGRPKAWLPFGSERLLQRVIRLVGTVAQPIIVVAVARQELPELPAGIAIVRDPVAGRGPLQGLAAGLDALPDSVELVYATGTDVPFIEPAWITRQADLIGDHGLAIPMIRDEFHPLAALYRRSAVCPVIERMLREDQLKLKCIVERVHTRFVYEEEMRFLDKQLGTLRNLNHPGDYDRALRDAGLSGQ